MRAESQNAAHVTALSGRAFVARAGQENALQMGDALTVGDSVRTDQGGKVNLFFTDGTELRLGENAQVELREFAYEPGGAGPSSFAAHIDRGMVRTITGEVVKLNPEGFSLSSPLGAADIRGTTVDALVQSDSTIFMITDMGGGRFVVVSSALGEELIVYLPGQGVEIYEDDAVRMAFLDSAPQGMREKFAELLKSMLDVRSSHDDFTLLFGNAEFLAALGAHDLGRGIGLLDGDNADILFRELEQLGVPDSMLFPSADSGLNTAFVWPTEIWSGTDGNDAWVGSINQHHNAQGLGGDDLLVVFNGRDTVFGGSGQDTIVKVAGVMTGGNALYGNAESQNSGPLEADHIIVRGPGAKDDPLDPSSYTDPANAGTWTAIEMSGGSVYGSAETLNGITLPSGVNTIDLYGNMSGGEIYGKAQTATDSQLPGAEINIQPAPGGGGGGTMSGGAIYGDAYEISGTSQCGDDTFNITNMSGGAIYGDAAKISGAVTGGDNEYYITGTMSGGTIVAGTGKDVIDIKTMTGGTIVAGTGTNVEDIIKVGTLQGTMEVKGEVEDITVTQANQVNTSQDNSKIEVGTLNGTIEITDGSIDIHLDEISGASTVTLNALTARDSLVRVDKLNNWTLTLEGNGDHVLYMESISSGTPSAGSLKATGGATIKVDSVTLDSGDTITLTAKVVALELVQGKDGGSVDLSGLSGMNAIVTKQTGAGIKLSDGGDYLYMTEMSGGTVKLGEGGDFMQVTKLGAEKASSDIKIEFGLVVGGDGEVDTLDLKGVTLLGDTNITLDYVDYGANNGTLDKIDINDNYWGGVKTWTGGQGSNWICKLENSAQNILTITFSGSAALTQPEIEQLIV